MLRNRCTILRLLQEKAVTKHDLFTLKVTLQLIHERLCLTTFPITEKRVKHMTCRGAYLTNLEVFVNMAKHCLGCLIYLLNRN